MNNNILSIGVGLFGTLLVVGESLRLISKPIIHNKNPRVLDILMFMLYGSVACRYNYALYKQLKN